MSKTPEKQPLRIDPEFATHIQTILDWLAEIENGNSMDGFSTLSWACKRPTEAIAAVREKLPTESRAD